MAELKQVAKWEFTDISFKVKEDKSVNHFVDSYIYAIFTNGDKKLTVHGFYDDNNTFVIRFMPTVEGIWKYTTYSNVDELNKLSGEIEATAPKENVHGLVQVDHKYHFAFSDKTPFYPFGTTAYVWNYQKPEIQAETLETLKKAPFNKLRMCVFPKHYDYNLREPEMTPFLGDIEHGFDLTQFDSKFFHKLEAQILELQKLNIEVDLILFHPYDRWGFSKMPEDVDMRYVSYVIARLSAFRNIWWSLANEFDLLTWKANTFWDKVFNKLVDEDPYNHLRSIHNWHCPPYHYRSKSHWYDHKKDWVSHVSIQHHDMYFIPEWEKEYEKPIMIDECRYEGNMDLGWGNITGEKMTMLFWQSVIAGGYATHGETYMNDDEIIWWAHGGRLVGTSPARIAFLRKIMEEGPVKRLIPVSRLSELIATRHWDATIGKNEDDNYYIIYFSDACPKYRHMDMLPEGKKYKAEIIDTWEMTITPVKGIIDNKSTIDLLSKPYIAIRLTAIE